MLPERRVLPARHEERQIALGRGDAARSRLRIDLVLGDQPLRAQELVEVLVREEALAGSPARPPTDPSM